MERIRLAALALLAAGSLAAAQSQWRDVPPARPIQAPFPLEGKLPLTVAIRPASAVSAQDQQLAANEDSSIRQRAGLQLIDTGSGWSAGTGNSGWSYRQIDCAAFPGHLFLRFTRDGGKGDVSAFTASIPRFGQGRDRIIPIQRRGYSLWSPVPVNAQTIAVFNHILAEERPNGEPEWAALAVCYAALAGTGSESIFSPIAAPILHVENSGEATIYFETDDPRAKSWTMIFDRRGVLQKAVHTAMPGWDARPVPAAQQPRWQPVPPAQAGAAEPVPAPSVQ
jgi:hypothetical protein